MRFLFILLISAQQCLAQTNSFVVRTTGKLPMLAYGMGQDRLGGAKAGYLDTGVVLTVIDSAKDMYLVQLSKYHQSYIAKSEVRRDTLLQPKANYLSNAWSVRGDSEYDYVNINLDEKLPYKSWMEIDPSKMIIDIYGVQSNTNWITQLRSAKEVKNVNLVQIEDDVLRVTISLKHAQHWGYTISYKNKSLSLRIRHQPAKVNLRHLTIGVDAGHGGSNTGASGLTTKTLEKNMTILFAQQLQKQLLRKGATVVMTRTGDTNIINTDRVLVLQKVMPDMLISLHLNSSSNTAAHGVSTYYKHIGYRPLTVSILKQMLQLKLNEFGNIGSFNFMLNAPTDFPNALVEIAFLSNAADEQRIINRKFQKDVAKKITKGIKQFLRSVK